MPSVRLKHLERWRDRHGRLRLYYRDRSQGGQRTPLRGPEGSPEFLADYQAAALGSTAPPTTARARAGTVGWLVVQYYQSSEFRQLQSGTQRTRRSILHRWLDWRPQPGAPPVAERPYASLRAVHLRRIRDSMLDRPSAAQNMLKAVRALFAFAVRYEHAQHNPADGIEPLAATNPDGIHTWTLAEVRQFAEHWPLGTREHLALALLFFTGRRRSDIVRLGRQHAAGDLLTIREVKRGQGMAAKVVQIPIVPALRQILDASPTGDLAYLVTAQNRPFTAAGFGNWFRDACTAAGLPHCSAHGLRKCLMATLAEHGATALMIQAVGGWHGLQEPARYTRAADRSALASQAAALIPNPFSQTR